VNSSERRRARVLCRALGITGLAGLALALIGMDAPRPRLDARPPAAPATAKPEHPPQPQLPPVGLTIPAYKPGPLPFRPGQRLTYRVSWLGIPAAEARIELHSSREDRDVLTAEAWLKTNGFVDMLFKMRDYIREEMSAATLETREEYFRQHETRSFNEYFVNFDHDAGVVTAVRRNRKGETVKRYIAGNGYGPLTGAIMALTQPRGPGSVFIFDVFTGDHRYVLDFKIARRERIRVPAGDFDAYRIVPGVVYLNDNAMRRELRYTLVWVSTDDRRLPLRAEAGTFIGSLRADLVRVDNPALASR
jgi:hypothetical protein